MKKSPLTLKTIGLTSLALYYALCFNGFTSLTPDQVFSHSESYNRLYIYKEVEQSESLQDKISKSNTQNVLHIISHGKPNQLIIDNSWLTAQEIATFLKQRKGEASHINNYGCELIPVRSKDLYLARLNITTSIRNRIFKNVRVL